MEMNMMHFLEFKVYKICEKLRCLSKSLIKNDTMEIGGIDFCLLGEFIDLGWIAIFIWEINCKISKTVGNQYVRYMGAKGSREN